jgi:serine/threonine protein kinase
MPETFCCVNQHINQAGRIWCSKCGSLVKGARVGDCVVAAFVGKGSTSAVYQAYQPALNNRRVVIKVLPPLGEQANVRNFQREAAVLAALSHPYILPIYTYGIIKEPYPISGEYSPYLVLPYIRQGSLADISKRELDQPWSLERVLSIMEDACEALEYAHARGVLHRDIKPANLLLIESHVLLADFGMAALIDNNSHLNADWAGSPGYMAPEVWMSRPGRYSDQYALAVTCFHLLTGQYPWQASANTSIATWIHLHEHVEPRTLYSLRPDIQEPVSMVLQRAMEKDPHRRYPSVMAFKEDLLSAAHDRTAALSPAGKDITAPSTLHQAVVNLSSQVSRRLSTGVLPESNWWEWRAMVLNLLAYFSLAALTATLYAGLVPAALFLLTAWPCLLLGPLVGRWFRNVAPSSFIGGLCAGFCFGLLDTLVSLLVCYGGVVLWLTFLHWGQDWLRRGDGLRIFIAVAHAIFPEMLTLLIAGALMGLGGGIVIGLLARSRYAQDESRKQRRDLLLHAAESDCL